MASRLTRLSAGFSKQRALLRATARVGILDRQRHRFLGNIHEMRPSEARPRGAAWSWRADGGGAAIVRCGRVQVGGRGPS
jgi:hypothetical protein